MVKAARKRPVSRTPKARKQHKKTPKKLPKKVSPPQAFIRRIRTYSTRTVRGVALAVLAVIVVMAATGLRPPLPFHLFSKADPNTDSTPPCTETPKEGDLFDPCPEYSLDFTKSKQKSVGELFNIVSGEPDNEGEAQIYTISKSNLRIQDGSLMITALNDPQQGYTSGRVDTRGRRSFL